MWNTWIIFSFIWSSLPHNMHTWHEQTLHTSEQKLLKSQLVIVYLTAGLFTSETDLCRSVRRGHSILGWGGRVCHVWHLCFPTLLAESAQSVIQVKPTGSALMRIGSALSLEAGRAYRVYVGHRKRKRTLSNTLEILRNSLRDAARHSKEYIYPSIMTQLSGSGFLSGVLGWDF